MGVHDEMERGGGGGVKKEVKEKAEGVKKKSRYE